MYFDNSELNEAQLKIYYTFLSADGVCGKEELEKLDSICRKMDIPEARKSEIMNKFTNDSISLSSNEGGIKAIVPHIDGTFTPIESMFPILYEDQTLNTIDCILEEQSSYSTILTDKSVQTNIIWNLINLGYSDTSF